MHITTEQIFTFMLFAFVFIIGTVIGSFLNVVILRAFSGESIVLPPSKCPKCGNRLKWWHNIPILSYIFLRGKCGFCKESISIQYPIVELITGILFTLMFWGYGMMLETLFGFIIISLLIVISVTDIKESIVFDSHVWTLIGVGLFYGIVRTVAQIIHVNQSSLFFTFSWDWILHSPITSSILGGLVGALAMFLLAILGKLIAGKDAFGEGDIYIMAGLGTIFGINNILFLLLFGAILQAFWVLPMFIKELFVQKDFKCLFSLGTLIILAVIFCLSTYKYNVSDVVTYILFALVALNTLAACYFIISGIKSNRTVTYCPFGPFLALSGLIALLLPNVFLFMVNLVLSYVVGWAI